MKKLIILSLFTVFTLLAWSFSAQAQSPAQDEKPTFYRLTPGIYVNGWPRFTVTYPKDWVEQRPSPFEVFHAKAPGSGFTSYLGFGVSIGQYPLPLDKYADRMVQMLSPMSTDVTVVSDKPSRFRDGTPAREIEVHYVLNGVPFNLLGLSMKIGDLLIGGVVYSSRGKIGEDLKAILYSLELQPGKDEPVKVPSDVQKFLDAYRSDMVSHDLAKVMTHFSDRYLNSGTRKEAVEVFIRSFIDHIISVEELGITEFEAAGDKAYLTGFYRINAGGFLGLNGGRTQLGGGGTSIIKENGEWKWYGNQRDPAP